MYRQSKAKSQIEAPHCHLLLKTEHVGELFGSRCSSEGSVLSVILGFMRIKGGVCVYACGTDTAGFDKSSSKCQAGTPPRSHEITNSFKQSWNFRKMLLSFSYNVSYDE